MIWKCLLSAICAASVSATLACNRVDTPDTTAGGSQTSPPGPAQLPASSAALGASLYDLPVSLTDQDGRALDLDLFRGHPVVISMFYASCPFACPTLISDIQRFERTLSAEVRSEVRVLLVSFDPARDTPQRLKALAAERKIDEKRWRLASAPDPQVRELSAALGLKYRELAGGAFNHSSAITLLDQNGVVAKRVEGLSQPLELLATRTTALMRARLRPERPAQKAGGSELLEMQYRPDGPR